MIVCGYMPSFTLYMYGKEQTKLVQINKLENLEVTIINLLELFF